MMHHKILEADLIRCHIRKIYATVAHTVDQMKNIGKWCCHTRFTFSFIYTLDMSLSHFNIKINDLILPLDQLFNLLSSNHHTSFKGF